MMHIRNTFAATPAPDRRNDLYHTDPRSLEVRGDCEEAPLAGIEEPMWVAPLVLTLENSIVTPLQDR